MKAEGGLERTQMRGRNGWFAARRYKVYGLPATARHGESVVRLDLWGGKPARIAPVRLVMGTEEARRLALAIGLVAEEVEEVRS